MITLNVLALDKAEDLIKNYSIDYVLKIIDTKLMLCIADDKTNELFYWTCVEQEVKNIYHDTTRV